MGTTFTRGYSMGQIARLGIDWGTSNRRAYLIDEQGQLLRRHEDGEGMLRAGGNFAASLRSLLQQFGLEAADVIMSGMVGSRNGWQEVPYLPIHEPLTRLGRAAAEIASGIPEVRCRIVPGYFWVDDQGVVDVMRGEETQILGVVHQHALDGWFLLPGTHSKWARVEEGRIREFATFMTGELFALLSSQGTLSKVMQEQQEWSAQAFEAGLRASGERAFTQRVFSCRALVVTDRMPAQHASAYLSGLLIGAELHDILQRSGTVRQQTIQIIGGPALARRYLDGLELLGMSARLHESDAVYVSALAALFQFER